MSDKERTLSGNFEITANLTDKRQVRMTGYVYSDDTPDELNTRLDWFQTTIDRQGIRYDLINKEAQIAAAEASMEAMREGYEELIALKAKGRKLTSQQMVGVDQYEPRLRATKEGIAGLRAAVAEGRKKLNGAAVG